MRQAHQILGFCAAAALLSFAFVITGMPSPPDGIPAALSPPAEETEEPVSSELSLGLAQAPMVEVIGTRESVPVIEFSSESERPCESIEEALWDETCAREQAEGRIEKLQAELAKAKYELKLIQFPLETPYGAFLASSEAESIRKRFAGTMLQQEDKRFPAKPAVKVALGWIKGVLEDEFPVFLRPGEAMWIAEREVFRDWRKYARTWDVALIRFLGPDRLIAELPAQRLAELREEHAGTGLFD